MVLRKEREVQMKKTYVKPQAFFESFELSANIAAGCAVKPGFAKYDCKYEILGVGSLFSDNCDYKYGKGDYDATFCYNVPSDTQRLFTS